MLLLLSVIIQGSLEKGQKCSHGASFELPRISLPLTQTKTHTNLASFYNFWAKTEAF